MPSTAPRRALFFTKQQVAQLLHMSIRTLDTHIASGSLITDKVGRRVLITRDSLLSFVPSLTDDDLDAAFGE